MPLKQAAFVCLVRAGAALAAALPLTFTEPYLVSPTPATSMHICWLTSEPTSQSYVEYGDTERYGARERAATYQIEGLLTVDEAGKYSQPLKVYQQIAHLKNLVPGRFYFYRAVSAAGGAWTVTPGYYFRTAPPPGTPIKFVLLSDLQVRATAADPVKFAGQQYNDLIIYAGDFVNTPNKAGEWFTVPGAPEADAARWFNMMQQTADGCRLLQYVPIFPAPGNHEIDDQTLLSDRKLNDRAKLSFRIYMQLFRPLYPEQEYGAGGKHWYAADYGDLHVVSLSVVRWFSWQAAQAPGWYPYDEIKSGSAQYHWLESDLRAAAGRKYLWVTQHWHMFNRSTDVAVPFTDPVPSASNPDQMEYPAAEDYLLRDLQPLFERYGVNAVNYGHSHVYERYRISGVSYIEAASIGNSYRGAKDPPCSPNGPCPEFEWIPTRTLMFVSIYPDTGMTAEGVLASVVAGGFGEVGWAIDSFQIAPPLRATPAP